MGGGVFYDMGVYIINGFCYVIGMELVQVCLVFCNIFNEVDVIIIFEFVFLNGVKGFGKISVVEIINCFWVDCVDGWYKLEFMQFYSGVQGVISDGKWLD